jgi:hypothetical protein
VHVRGRNHLPGQSDRRYKPDVDQRSPVKGPSQDFDVGDAALHARVVGPTENVIRFSLMSLRAVSPAAMLAGSDRVIHNPSHRRGRQLQSPRRVVHRRLGSVFGNTIRVCELDTRTGTLTARFWTVTNDNLQQA